MGGTPVDTRGERPQPVVLDRYVLFDVIGGGGAATVHVGRIVGAGGFSRVVAIKRLHPHRAADADFATMLVDEARLASRIRHANVVQTLDIVSKGSELLLVMDYVHGLSVAELVRLAKARNEGIPLGVAVRVVLDVLAGLEAAHVAKNEHGQPLRIVHRDISPQNVIVDGDGVSRIVDFGVAKGEGKLLVSRVGQIKGKLRYMAPEQLRAEPVDLRADLYAVGIMLWELITGRVLFARSVQDLARVLRDVGSEPIPAPSQHAHSIPPALDAVVLRALQLHPGERFTSAAAMAVALESAVVAASSNEVADTVTELGCDVLAERAKLVTRVDQSLLHEPSDTDVATTADGSGHRPIEMGDSAPTGSVDLLRPGDLRSAPSRRGMEPESPSPFGADPVPRVERPAALQSSTAAPQRVARWMTTGLLFMMMCALAATGLVVFRRGRTIPRAPTPNPPAAPVTSSLPDPAPSGVTSVEVPVVPSTPTNRSSPSSTVRLGPSRAPLAPTPPDCANPFRIDAEGHKIPRRECFPP